MWIMKFYVLMNSILVYLTIKVRNKTDNYNYYNSEQQNSVSLCDIHNRRNIDNVLAIIHE